MRGRWRGGPSARRFPGWAPWALAALCVVGVGVVRHWPVLQGGTSSTVGQEAAAVYPWRAVAAPTPFEHATSDYAESVYPGWVQVDEAVDERALPHWNRWSFAGTPAWANGLGVVSYPPRWLLSTVAGPAGAHDLFIAIHQVAAGLALLALLAACRRTAAAALVCAVAYMLGTFLEGWAQLEIFLPPIALLPFAMAAAEMHLRTERRRWLVLAAIPAAMLVAGTGIGVAAIALAVLAAWWLLGALAGSRPATASPRDGARRLTGPAAGLALACALAAPVVLPVLLLARVGSRSTAGFAAYDALSRSMGASVLDLVWPLDPPFDPKALHRLVYVGPVLLVLAVIGAFSRGRGARFGAALGAIVVAASVLTPARWLTYHLLPFTRPTLVGRVGWLVLLGAGLAAAAGLDAIRRRVADRRMAIAGTAVIGLLVAAPQVPVGRDANPSYVARTLGGTLPGTPLVDHLRALDGARRAVGDRLLLLGVADERVGPPPFIATLSAAAHLTAGNGYESLMVRRNLERWRVVEGAETAAAAVAGALAYRNANPRGDLDLNAAARAGVDALVVPPGSDLPFGGITLDYDGADGRVWLLRDARPAAAVTGAVTVVASATESIDALRRPAADRGVTVLAPDADALAVYGRCPPAPSVPASITDEDAEHLRVNLSSATGGLLVLDTSWAPGWSATAGGRRLRTLAADHAALAVAVPCGTTSVELHYRPPGFFAGTTLAAAGALAVAAAAILPAVRRRSRRPNDRAMMGTSWSP